MFIWGNRIPWNYLHWDTQMRVPGVLYSSTTWKKWEHPRSILPQHLNFPQVTLTCKHLSSFLHFYTVAFPSGSVVKNLRAMQETLGLIPGLGRFPWRREWQHTPVLLPGEFHGQRSLVGYSPWGPRELDTIKWLTLFTTLQTLIRCGLCPSYSMQYFSKIRYNFGTWCIFMEWENGRLDDLHRTEVVIFFSLITSIFKARIIQVINGVKSQYEVRLGKILLPILFLTLLIIHFPRTEGYL